MYLPAEMYTLTSGTKSLWNLAQPGYPPGSRTRAQFQFELGHALGHVCRFAGHTDFYYSVAQHCCLMHDIAEHMAPDEPMFRTWALLHDAHEAYIGDIATPLAKAFDDVPGFTDRLNLMKRHHDMAILEHLGLPSPGDYVRDAVHHLDRQMFLAECRDLFKQADKSPDCIVEGITCVSPQIAAAEYVTRLRDCVSAVSGAPANDGTI